MEHRNKFPFPTTTDKKFTNVVPSDLKRGKAKCMMPHGVPVNFSEHNRNYERFLAGPALVRDGKIDIEGTYCHGSTQVSVKVDKNVVHRETFQVWPSRGSRGQFYA